jgi:RNA polymerase sigma factor (sigma-70 family)
MPDERSAPTGEATLVASVAAGSEDALATLYDRHANSIFATAYRLTGDRSGAEDVVQEVFLTLWNRAERFDPAVGSLAAWLGTIARNRAVDRLRAASRRPQLVSLSPIGGEDEPDSSALERLASWPGWRSPNAR